MSEQEAPVQAPTDIAGVGIHLSYLRRDMLDLKKTLENVTTNYVPLNIYIASKAETEEKLKFYEKEIRELVEFRDTLTGKMWGIGVMAGGIVGMITLIVNHLWK